MTVHILNYCTQKGKLKCVILKITIKIFHTDFIT